MKRFLLLTFLFINIWANAQINPSDEAMYPRSFQDPCFTVNPSAQLFIYRYNYSGPPFVDSGFIFGKNAYGITEFAQVYEKDTSDNVKGPAPLIAVIVYYSRLTNVSNSNTFARLYNVDPNTNAPTSLITSSPAVPLNNVVAGTNYSYYSIPTGFTYSTLPNKFAVSVNMPVATGDTTAIFSTGVPCGGGDSLVWQKQSNGSWINSRSWFGGVSFKADLHLHPLFDNTVSLSKYELASQYFDAYIQNNQLIIKSIALEAISRIELIDINAKQIDMRMIENGKFRKYQLQDLQSGVYFLNIETKNKQKYHIKLIQ